MVILKVLTIIRSEVRRAIASEKELQYTIGNETTRATAEEARLQSTIERLHGQKMLSLAFRMILKLNVTAHLLLRKLIVMQLKMKLQEQPLLKLTSWQH